MIGPTRLAPHAEGLDTRPTLWPPGPRRADERPTRVDRVPREGGRDARARTQAPLAGRPHRLRAAGRLCIECHAVATPGDPGCDRCSFRGSRHAHGELQPRQPTTGASPTRPSVPTIGKPADDGARIVGVTTVDARTRDLMIQSPAVLTRSGVVQVRLLLPSQFDAQPAARWPVLYLLAGSGQDHTSWTQYTDVEKLTAPTDLLVVMPDAGASPYDGWYSDWWNNGAGGPPEWETFDLVELRQLLERNWHAGDKRADRRSVDGRLWGDGVRGSQAGHVPRRRLVQRPARHVRSGCLSLGAGRVAERHLGRSRRAGRRVEGPRPHRYRSGPQGHRALRRLRQRQDRAAGRQDRAAGEL